MLFAKARCYSCLVSWQEVQLRWLSHAMLRERGRDSGETEEQKWTESTCWRKCEICRNVRKREYKLEFCCWLSSLDNFVEYTLKHIQKGIFNVCERGLFCSPSLHYLIKHIWYIVILLNIIAIKITVFYFNVFLNVIYSSDAKLHFSASLLQSSVSHETCIIIIIIITLKTIVLLHISFFRVLWIKSLK